jgi:4-hydroxyphenylpyruvate dioxygenase
MNRPKAKKIAGREYLEFYNGEGVQHVAIATNNIIETVTALQTGSGISKDTRYLL